MSTSPIRFLRPLHRWAEAQRCTRRAFLAGLCEGVVLAPFLLVMALVFCGLVLVALPGAYANQLLLRWFGSRVGP